MESFNRLPFIIFLLLITLLVICFVLYKFIKKVKGGWILLLTISLVIIGGIKIHDRIINSVFYDFKDKMCSIHPEIKNIELQIGRGRNSCTIDVYIEKGVDNEKVEDIFIEMLKEFNLEPMSSYLKGSTNNRYKNWTTLYILFYGSEQGSFYSEHYQHSDWFTEENQKEQIWKNSYTGTIYYLSGYLR
ncbi:hypothetical protein [Lacrimispora sp.]|uniref:hypothetical protein n=1 Tax=Lacrimispora sp. TaxID=2719234 RepID=UPI0032E4E49F